MSYVSNLFFYCKLHQCTFVRFYDTLFCLTTSAIFKYNLTYKVNSVFVSVRVGQARPFILQLDASNNETCKFNGRYVDDSETTVKVVLCPKVVSLKKY